MSGIIDPPESGLLPSVECPSCQHPINEHVAPGCLLELEPVGVELCPCFWSPNDIAGSLLAAALRPDPGR